MNQQREQELRRLIGRSRQRIERRVRGLGRKVFFQALRSAGGSLAKRAARWFRRGEKNP